MAQAQLDAFFPWLQLEELTHDVVLPPPLNSKENYKSFLETTTTPQEYHHFLNQFLVEEKELVVLSWDKLTKLVCLMTEHINLIQGRKGGKFDKVKQYFCHTFKYIVFISGK